MAESTKPTALRVLEVAFKGLAPLLFEYGITVPEAENLLRTVCVRHAARSPVGSGRALNDSQIEALTDVNRHVVAKLLKPAPDECPHESLDRARMKRVIEGWEIDHAQKGLPIDLEMGNGQSGTPCVWTLIQRYVPDVWPPSIIDDLIRADLVETLADGRLRLNSNARRKLGPSAQDLERAAQHTHDLMRATLNDFEEPTSKRRVQTAQSLEIDPADAHLVRKMLTDRMGWMFSWLTDELNSPRWRRNSTGESVRLGITGVTFEEVIVKESPDEVGKTAKSNQTKKKARQGSRHKSERVGKRK